MEEIGIEKLVELLREYSYENHGYSWVFYTDGDFEGSVSGTDHDLDKEEMGMVIKSKEYGFIKWLVENDKIDLDNEELVSLMSELGERRNPVKCLLMLLAIQDEPIRFICEIIK